MVLGSRDPAPNEQGEGARKRRRTEAENEGTGADEITVTSTYTVADTSASTPPEPVPHASAEKTERLRRGVLEHIDTLFEKSEFVAGLPRLLRIDCSAPVSDPSGDLAKLKEWSKNVVNSLFDYRREVCRLRADGNDETLTVKFGGLGKKNSSGVKLYRKLVDKFKLPTKIPFRTRIPNARNLFLHSLDCFDISRAPTANFFASLLPNEVLHGVGPFVREHNATYERVVLRRELGPFDEADHTLLGLGRSPYVLRDETPTFECPPMKFVEGIREYRDAWKAIIQAQLRVQVHEFLQYGDPLSNGWLVQVHRPPDVSNGSFCLVVDDVQKKRNAVSTVTLRQYGDECEYLYNGARPLHVDDMVVVRFFSTLHSVNRLLYNYERWKTRSETGKEMEEATYWARVVSLPERYCAPKWVLKIYLREGMKRDELGVRAEILPTVNIYQPRCQLHNLARVVELRRELQSTLVDPTTTPSSVVGQPPRGFTFETEHLLHHYKKTLNDSQYEMCMRVLNRYVYRASGSRIDERSGFILVQGPPGTGKSTAIVALVNLLIEKPIALKVLLCAPSNAAVDVLIERLLSGVFRVIAEGERVRLQRYTPMIARLSSTEGTTKAMQVSLNRLASDLIDPLELERIPPDEVRHRIYKEKLGILKSPKLQVICATLGSLGQNIVRRAELGVSLVIVDEASQCTEPDVLAALVSGATKKVSPSVCVLVGDPMQLPPTLRYVPRGQGKDLERSLLERLMENRLHAVGDVLCLNTQYRMHPAISYFARTQFYHGKLQDSSSVRCRKEYCMPYHWDGAGRFGPVTFIDTYRTRVYEQNYRESKYNRLEKDIVAALLLVFQRLYDCDLKTKGRWGVLSPYRAQVGDIQEMVERVPILRQMDIKCTTIDSMQGGEKDLIILSTVRSNPGGRIGFLDDYRRFNVALTRPRKSLIVIGNSDTLGTDPEWSRFISYTRKRAPGDYRYITLPAEARVKKDLCPELLLESDIGWL